MGLFNEISKQKEKLNKEISSCEEKQRTLHTKITEVQQKRDACRSAAQSVKMKKYGDLYFIAAIILTIIFTVMVLSTKQFPLYWYGLPLLFLVVGLIRKLYGRSKHLALIAPYGSVDQAWNMCTAAQIEYNNLENKMDALLSRLVSAKEELMKVNNMTRQYTGKDWKLKSFRATPENIRAMELDTEHIYIVLQNLRPSEMKNWHTNWMNYGDSGPSSAGFEELGRCGSWKLQVTQVVLRYVHTVQPSHCCDPGGPAEWKRLLKAANIRDPQTTEEEEYLNQAWIGALLMARYRVEQFSRIPRF